MRKNIGAIFLEKTKLQNLPPSDQMKGIPSPSMELPYDTTQEATTLPDPQEFQSNKLTVQDAIELRQSIRIYTKIPLTLRELSYLLWCTQGIKETYTDSVTLRTVPSAGARHALETYLLINNIDGLRKGLYRFFPSGHQLITLTTESTLTKKITKACLGQDSISSSAVTFIWIAIPERMTWRYGERGFRYLFLDVGHVCQNLYLAGESISCGVCAIGAFMDDDLNHILGLNGIHQFVIYLATVGKK